MKTKYMVFAAAALAVAACTTPKAPTMDAAPMGKRAAGQDQADPLRIFRAFGTEPFWNINVENSTLTFTTPDNPAGVALQGERHPAHGGVQVTGVHDGKPFALTVGAGDCSDGMSDNRCALVATFRYDGVDYKGCGEAAK